MTQTILQYILYLAIPIALAIPLGIYISKVMGGEKVFLSPVLAPCEGFIYKLLRIDKEKQMTWKDYLVAVLAFSLLGFVFLFLILMLQGYLPLNPQNAPGMSWDLAFNTAVSFITNTNWQSYSGEMQASNFSQMLGLTVQNFLSAAVGISVLFALIRGFVIVKSKALGNFWVDMTRSVLYVLLPLSLVAALLLVGGGVVQSLSPSEATELLEPVAVDRDGQVMEDALIDSVTGKVTIGGVEQPEAQIVTTQLVPLAPAASQVAIKQLGTNGGGVMGANSAHPLENPNAFTNLVEMLSIILIPMALCFSFGRSIKSHSQGRAIFFAMSGRAIEAAGDVDILLLDKTGTITLGNRQACAFIPVDGCEPYALAEAAQLASLSDETPEGRSVVVLAKEQFGIRNAGIAHSEMSFIPFTAATRMSGVDFGDTAIRKGAADSVKTYVESLGGVYSAECDTAVKAIAQQGGTPLVVTKNDRVLGIIHLKDIIKNGVKEKFADLRRMGIRTIMITGDNPLTAAAIAAEAGVDDFLAEATPQGKLDMIRELQRKPCGESAFRHSY